jgi:hypothetical protein
MVMAGTITITAMGSNITTTITTVRPMIMRRAMPGCSIAAPIRPVSRSPA